MVGSISGWEAATSMFGIRRSRLYCTQPSNIFVFYYFAFLEICGTSCVCHALLTLKIRTRSTLELISCDFSRIKMLFSDEFANASSIRIKTRHRVTSDALT